MEIKSYFCTHKKEERYANLKKTKIVTIVSTIVVLALAAFIFFRFFFVYSSGVNAGDLNYFQQEGIVFKTYEGKIIQSGFKSVGKSTEGLHSNELKFSVTDKAVVDKLMRASGKHIELRWKRYMGTLPWRGNSEYIATGVLSIE